MISSRLGTPDTGMQYKHLPDPDSCAFTPNPLFCRCSELNDLCEHCENGFAETFNRSLRSFLGGVF